MRASDLLTRAATAALLGLAAATSGSLTTACAMGGCFRHSDCSRGGRCVAGKCVSRSAERNGPTDAAGDEAVSDGGAAGESGIDSTSAPDAAADASSGDAPTDRSREMTADRAAPDALADTGTADSADASGDADRATDARHGGG